MVTRLVVAIIITFSAAAFAQPQGADQKQRLSPEVLFQKMIGQWEGPCRTWFEPGKLADESKVTGEISEVLGGLFLRHTYETTMQNKPRRGEELIGFNAVTKQFQIS